MSEELYNSVPLFDKYEGIKNKCNVEIDDEKIDLCDPSIFGDVCNDKHFYRKCLIADKYLTYIEDEEGSRNIKEACKYFSYWAYKEMIMDKKYSYSVSTLHENINKISNFNICKKYVENISTETFLNIDNLYKLYQNFKEILNGDEPFNCDKAKKCVEFYKTFEGTCYLDSDDPFCIGLKKFREAYNKTMKSAQKCEEYKILQELQKRPEKSANTIATAAITAISFASIMTYKFTPLGSWVRHRLSGNKNMINKLEKEFKASQNSSKIQDMEYRVPYNSS
ncbi:VIR protein [Plasmodium vivax]|uniref:VIR protein n=1 Tax=Plasmodium vivax TaxID=5855 RepID=A0A1G4EAR8_PLAVI|nr:VIR protein [Plasmodium vivax]